MFAVVRTGGKQYRVAAGDKIVVEKLDGNAGDRVMLGDVLLAGEGSDLRSTDGLTVAAEIIAQAKADKVTVFKKRRRHNYRRKKGHRQQHTILKIVAIGDQKESKPAASKAAKPAAKAADSAAAPADAAASTAPATKASAKNASGDNGKKIKPVTPEEGSGDISGKPTPNPAPSDPEVANPEIDSTKNAAVAKGGPKKTPKAK